MSIDITGRLFSVNGDVYVSLPLVNKAANRSEPRQFLCSEMVHWDDYRQERNLNDGKPPMQQLFASEYESVQLRNFTNGTETYVTQLVSVTPTQAGSPSQSFCSEMQHWDDYCAQRNIKTGTPSMSRLFRPFEATELLVFDPSEQRVKVFMTNSVAMVSCGADKQTYCSEMEHWDDFFKAKTGQYPQPTMASLFRAA